MAAFNLLYDVKEELGTGTFSVVKRCIHKESQEDFAVKIVNMMHLGKQARTKLEREAKICKMLCHKNVIRLHDTYIDENSHCFVFDLVTGGELFDDIVNRESYSERDASRCIHQIFEAISYCHRNNIIHRDVKPENLLLDGNPDDHVIKLADFGIAVVSQDNERDWFGFAGSPGYLSPEIIRKEPYGKPVDVWACGVVLYVLLVGYLPFSDDDDDELYSQIKNGDYSFPPPEWDTVSDSVKSLIDSMLDNNQNDRITAGDVLRHPWVANRSKVALGIHRQGTIDGLAKLNAAKRKFKAAVAAVTTVRRMSTLLDKIKNQTPDGNSEVPSTCPEVTDAALENAYLNEKEEILAATSLLMSAIELNNLAEYKKLVDPSLTAFDPNIRGQLVSGTSFHEFYFQEMTHKAEEKLTRCNTEIRVTSPTSAVVTYQVIRQVITTDGTTITENYDETRIWQKKKTGWKNVHFHRT